MAARDENLEAQRFRKLHRRTRAEQSGETASIEVSFSSFSTKESHKYQESSRRKYIAHTLAESIYFSPCFVRTELFSADLRHLSFLTYGAIFSFLIFVWRIENTYARGKKTINKSGEAKRSLNCFKLESSFSAKSTFLMRSNASSYESRSEDRPSLFSLSCSVM